MINVDKTQKIFLAKRKRKFGCYLGDVRLEQVREYKYLGVTFSDDLRWDKQMASRRLVLSTVVNGMKRFGHTFGSHTLRKVIQGKLIPQALYGAELLAWDRRASWEGLESNSLKLLLELPKIGKIQAVKRELRTVDWSALGDARALHFYFFLKDGTPRDKLSEKFLPEIMLIYTDKKNPVVMMLKRLEDREIRTERGEVARTNQIKSTLRQSALEATWREDLHYLKTKSSVIPYLSSQESTDLFPYLYNIPDMRLHTEV